MQPDMTDQDLLNASNGSYSTSDWGCVGDTVAISPRVYPVPGYLREFNDWAQALREATDACTLQNGVCWILKAEDQQPRYGQESDGGCPGCRGPGPIGFDGLELGKYPRARRRSMGPARPFPGAVMRQVQRNWRPVGVATLQGLSKVVPEGAVLPLWQRIWRINAPARLAANAAGLDYRSAVRAAQVISQRLGKPLVVGADHGGTVIPVTYVEPGGLVRTYPRRRGFETNVYSMTPLEVRQAFLASRGGSLMPHGM